MPRFKALAAGFTATALTTLVLAAAAAAVAASTITVSFFATSGSSAGWTPNHHAFKLHVAGNPSTAAAIVLLHHFPSKAPSSAPTFTASFYQSGTPRWYIKFANGDYLFGYPAPFSQWEAKSASGATLLAYGSYSQAKAAVKADSGGTLPKVKKVDIVADGSSPPPYTTTVSDVTYAGQNITP